MPSPSAAVASTVEKLRSLLEREPALRGGELERAVAEKETLVNELESSIRGLGPEELKGLQETLAPLSFANGLSLKSNRMRLQLSRLQKSGQGAAPERRLDIIT